MLDPPSAIFFHPDQIQGEGRDLVGRRSAGSGFLNGWLTYVDSEKIRAITRATTHAEILKSILKARGDPRPLVATSLQSGQEFSDAGCVFFPGPSFQGATWRRQRFGPNRVSLVGITHTTSTRRVIEGFHALMSEPVEEWDAIICTSHAVRSVVARQFEAEMQYFQQRFGATRVPQPQLPVIPLGVDAASFIPREGARKRMRLIQGVPNDAVVVMTMGRFSPVEKANPVGLLLALEAAAGPPSPPLHLWMTGWAARQDEEDLYHRAAQLAPTVTVRFLDGRDPDVRRDVWAGADIFTLPSDSIQETFGLAPVEAMAAGLPVVVPDWDGFRDTVRHNETGFLVPTRMAQAGMGAALARRFASGADPYLSHLALVQAQVQIDVPAYQRALETLVRDPDLRTCFGEAGRRHVAENLDWAQIVPRYLELARELAERRATTSPSTPPLSPSMPNPLEIDPFDLYAGYPTTVISAATPLYPGPLTGIDSLDLIDHLSGRTMYGRRVTATETALKILAVVADRPGLTVLDLARELTLAPAQTASIVLSLAKSNALLLPEPPLRL